MEEALTIDVTASAKEIKLKGISILNRNNLGHKNTLASSKQVANDVIEAISDECMSFKMPLAMRCLKKLLHYRIQLLALKH